MSKEYRILPYRSHPTHKVYIAQRYDGPAKGWTSLNEFASKRDAIEYLRELKQYDPV